MKQKTLEVGFFFGLLAVSGAVLLMIFMPFLMTIFVAALFAIIFFPVFEYFKKKFNGRGNMSALTTVALVLVIILMPLFVMGTVLVQESLEVARGIQTGDGLVSYVEDGFERIELKLDELAPDADISIDLRSFVQTSAQWVQNNIAGVFSSAAKLVINIFLMIIALFFFLRDGDKIKQILIEWSPMQDKYDISIMEKIRVAVDAVVKGSLFIAAIQGFLVAVGFLIFGVPSVVLWGFVATIAALIPSVGTGIVWIPGVLYLFFVENDPFMAIGLALWGTLIVGLVDNFLRPILIERGIKIHPFLILLSVFGGILMFGPVGFLLGPIVLSFVFALIEVYPKIMHEGEQEDLGKN